MHTQTQDVEETCIFYNFRKIVDGAGSLTVFSGNEPLKDEMFTHTNHYVSGKNNWLFSVFFFVLMLDHI